MIVGVQFESNREPGTFYGREYSYLVADGIKLAAGDVVKAPTVNGEGIAKVTRELTESQVDERILPRLETIISGPISADDPAYPRRENEINPSLFETEVPS